MIVGMDGALIPAPGRHFSRYRHPTLARTASVWRRADGLTVISTAEYDIAPGTVKQTSLWHLSCAVHMTVRDEDAKGRPRTRQVLAMPSDADMQAVLYAFEPPVFHEDAPTPNGTRHLWCPLEDEHRPHCASTLWKPAPLPPTVPATL